jgi:hypothetical protein
MILAIVGSRELDEDQEIGAWSLVEKYVSVYKWIFPDLKVISGGAPGVDTMAEMDAITILGEGRFEKYEPTPEERKLPGFAAYKPRNIRIAEACDRLVCIQSVLSHPKIGKATYGAGWTHDYAKQIGKATSRYWV